jgi:hypothetical protein
MHASSLLIPESPATPTAIPYVTTPEAPERARSGTALEHVFCSMGRGASRTLHRSGGESGVDFVAFTAEARSKVAL